MSKFVLLVCIALYTLIIGATFAHADDVRSHRTSVRRTHTPRRDATLFSHDSNYRTIAQWCQNHTNLCVRAGNTYIIMAR